MPCALSLRAGGSCLESMRFATGCADLPELSRSFTGKAQLTRMAALKQENGKSGRLIHIELYRGASRRALKSRVRALVIAIDAEGQAALCYEDN